jgi:hypothetical protein
LAVKSFTKSQKIGIAVVAFCLTVAVTRRIQQEVDKQAITKAANPLDALSTARPAKDVSKEPTWNTADLEHQKLVNACVARFSGTTNSFDTLAACDKDPGILPSSPAPIYAPDADEPPRPSRKTQPKIMATIIGEDNSNAPCGGLILWNKPGYEADRRALARFKGGEKAEYLGTDSKGTSWSSTIVKYHGMQGYIDFEACVVPD